MSNSPIGVAVFISGDGRTLQNLIKHSCCKVVLVGADRQCGGLKHAQKEQIPTTINPGKELTLRLLHLYKVDLICLAGYLTIFPITEELEGKVINIHPSLIPKFCGKGMYGNKVHQAVIDSATPETGCTVHFCNNEFDKGPIVLQNRLVVDPSWNAKELADAVFELEKKTYPQAIEQLADEIRRRRNAKQIFELSDQ